MKPPVIVTARKPRRRRAAPVALPIGAIVTARDPHRRRRLLPMAADDAPVEVSPALADFFKRMIRPPD